MKDQYGFPEAVVHINGQLIDDSETYYTFLDFTNVELSGVAPVDLTVKARKYMENTGKEEIGPEGFQIVLTDVTEGEQTAEETAVPLTIEKRTGKKGKVSFDLHYTVADLGKTFRYRLTETDEGKQGVTYDATIHDFQVEIGLDENYKLTAVLLLPGENGQWEEAAWKEFTPEFTNQFNVDKPAEPGSQPPKTGDNSNLHFWIMMMLASGLAAILLIRAERRALRVK